MGGRDPRTWATTCCLPGCSPTKDWNPRETGTPSQAFFYWLWYSSSSLVVRSNTNTYYCCVPLKICRFCSSCFHGCEISCTGMWVKIDSPAASYDQTVLILNIGAFVMLDYFPYHYITSHFSPTEKTWILRCWKQDHVWLKCFALNHSEKLIILIKWFIASSLEN